ncbi:type III secretion system inner membrane ring lipoprotein SctJ [Pseudooceanicola aestuarii]|uniref:type III secretion system inner membrane ring lipoprotein SctJ n=1 Tax=Pseudooceanicola aestuarii TaxID=2697319 RepID=UPI0013D74820|nr:type III secretion inner membrane ring lipoprotein SctJ [Pseudooceanicola aestuarii]
MIHIFPRRLLLALLVCLALAACKTEIHTNLTEREANEILGALLEANIDAQKLSGGDENFAISVQTDKVQTALAVLDARGLPRNNRESIGQVFAKSGIVSSPFEERVRYVYALGEDVAQTLQQIDGVLVARVHIVMPEAPELGQEVKPSSAAVFIKQRAGFDLDFLMPQIRRLVANAIEGVEYEAVTVVLVEAQPNLNPEEKMLGAAVRTREVLPGLSLTPEATQGFWMWAGGLAGLAGLLLITTIALAWRSSSLSRRLRVILADEDPA